MSFKDSLNLPRTDFPMRARLPEREPERLERWKASDLYGSLRRGRHGASRYLLHDGPPYANGHIHLGTAMNKIVKDLVVRSRTLAGLDVPYVPGWDCHGMPIEHHVTRQMRQEAGPEEEDWITLRHTDPEAARRRVLEVRRRCREYAERYVDVQRDEFRRLGCMGDWDRPYLTLQPVYEAAVLSTFRDLVAEDYVYNGLRAIHWCPVCQTALAEAEVEYRDHTSQAIHVAFPLVASEVATAVLEPRLPDGYGVEDVDALIWTTTPWTIPANLAIAVHPRLSYVLVAVDSRSAEGARLLLLAEGRAQATLESLGRGEDGREILATFPGADLEGMRYRHPLAGRESAFERTSPFILADHVTLEQGTGLVHTAPGHGHEDFEVGREYELEVLCPVDEAGVFDERAGEFVGLNVWDANAAIIRALEDVGALRYQEEETHSYPHCWRCKSPLIYRATEQWFLAVDRHQLRQRLLSEVEDRVDWYPEWGRQRIGGMLENRPDWCLSRQRAWGVPIPAVRCTGCDTVRLDVDVVERALEIVADEGSDAWFKRPVADFLPHDASCDSCSGSEFAKEQDIFDVWFESGVSHRAVLESGAFDELTWPSDLYLEGTDQHRGWFQVSLITATATRRRAPYDTVVTHGFITDDRGHKMSKSLGNVISPQDVVEEYGADILRLYFASVDYTRDIPFSKALLEPVVESYRKIRNTFRFLLGNLGDFDPATDALPPPDWEPIDRWAVDQLVELAEKVGGAYEAFRFHQGTQRLHQFFVVTLSATYLDILKDRLYTSAPESRERRAAQTALLHIADALTRLLAPVMPFTTDEVWEQLPGDRLESVHLATFPDLQGFEQDEEEADELARLMRLRGDVLTALERRREEDLLGSGLEAAVWLRPIPGDLKQESARAVERHAGWLKRLFIASQTHLLEAGAPDPEDALGDPAVSDDGGWQILITRAAGDKCERCWTFNPTVGDDERLPTVCDRCAAVLERISFEPAAG